MCPPAPLAAPRHWSPCSSAPFTPASSAFSRNSASASTERKRRPGSASGAVVGQDAVGERVQLRVREAVTRRAARSATSCWPSTTCPTSAPASLSAISAPSSNSRVLPTSWRIAAAEQQVGVEPRVQDAGLLGERGHGDGVLEQAAQVGVVARARAGRAAELGAERLVAEERSRAAGARSRVVHLAREVLEEAVELLDVAVGDRQELGRVGPRPRASDRPHARPGARRGSARPARPPDTRSPRSNWPARKSASRNARPGIAPVRSRSSRPGRGPVARGEAVLAGAGEHAVDLAARRAARRLASHEPICVAADDRTSGTVATVDVMDDLIWRERPTLRAPRAGVRLQGLERRGRGRLGGRVSFINDRFDAVEVARIDPEEFYDFTAVRPDGAADRGPHARDRLAATTTSAAAPGARRRARPRDLPGRRALAALAALHCDAIVEAAQRARRAAW